MQGKLKQVEAKNPQKTEVFKTKNCKGMGKRWQVEGII